MDASPPWAHHLRLEIEPELGSLPPTDGVRGARCWASNWTCCVREQSTGSQHNAQDVCLASVTHFKQKAKSKVTISHPVIKPWELAIGAIILQLRLCQPSLRLCSEIPLGINGHISKSTLQCPKGVLRVQMLSFNYEKQAPIIVNNTVLDTSKLLRD